jgi:methionyl-tRNA formyltransferase
LWERALAPLGQKLLGDVIEYAKTHKALPAKPQDEQFATNAPSLPKPHFSPARADRR